MSTYTAALHWERGAQPFTDNRYSRRHRIRFDGGVEIPGSSSPQVVPLPLSDPAAVDPEEAFVAALASCHMLWFLSLAAKGGFLVDDYRDQPTGEMASDERGRLAMTTVTLRPQVRFSGDRQPDAAGIAALHAAAHAACYLANSVRTAIRVESPA